MTTRADKFMHKVFFFTDVQMDVELIPGDTCAHGCYAIFLLHGSTITHSCLEAKFLREITQLP